MLSKLVFVALLFTYLFSGATPAQPYVFENLPSWVPPPRQDDNNLLTKEKIELGRHLFYDKRLSIDNSVSCSSCHHQKNGFADKKKLSNGVHGHKTRRNSMSLTNVIYNSNLTWANPQITSLEAQLLIPLFGTDPPEMGMAGKENLLIDRLKKDPQYVKLFKKAFPEYISETDRLISIATIAMSLASFQKTLLSFKSPYDLYKYEGKEEAISASAKRGETLFFGERLECYHCHGGFNFTDSISHKKLPFPEKGFHNTGLYNIDGKGGYPKENQGLYEVTGNPEDMGKFRAPTLRNIEVTAPYMHDGSIPTLEEVIRKHYAIAGMAALVNQKPNPNKSEFITGFYISDDEIKDLVNFLKSLTDREFLNNTKHSNPWVNSKSRSNVKK